MTLNIVLVEPRIHQNTGNIARTCAVTGAQLHLVEPLGFSIDDAKLKRAGLDYWDKLSITYYPSLEDFMEKHVGDALFFFSTKAPKNYCEAEYPDDCYIVFGREDKGLPECLLESNIERCVRIPMLSALRSLNLANSVAIGVYEVLRQHDFADLTEGSAYFSPQEG